MPLSIPLWLPLGAVLLAALAPRRLGPKVGLVGSLGALGCACYLIAAYQTGGGQQFVTDAMWIPTLGIHYKLAIDGLNLFLVALSALLFTVAFAAAQLREWERSRTFYFWLGLAESGVIGALLSQDLALFVFFFDLMLIPFYFLTGQWGGRRRVQATTKLVIYTLVGSLLMLAAAIATGVLAAPQGGLDFALSTLQAHRLSGHTQDWIFLLFSFAFLVKMPAFPFHGWMPDGYRAMPLPVLAAFSGAVSKVAAYGFLRIALPLYPQAASNYQPLLLAIALASILYGSAMAFTTTQTRLIAGYSSVAQMGFITLGIFSLRPEGAQGAILQMINHGIVVAPLLLIIGVLAARAGGSEDLRDMGGIAFRAPVFASAFLLVALATLAMPGSGNFVGEFLILLGTFQSKIVFGIVAFAGVAMASVYMLRAFIRSMHNPVGGTVASRDIRLGDRAVLLPLCAVILFFAFWPQAELERAQGSVVRAVSSARAAAQGGAVAAHGNPVASAGGGG